MKRRWMRRGWSRWTGIVASVLGLLAFQGCGVGTGNDGEGPLVAGIRVEALEFLPAGSRFVLADSATRISIRGYHAGYACSEILEMGLDGAASGNPGEYAPLTRIRLPGSAGCALDTTGRDTTIFHAFGMESDTVRLLNTAGAVTDSAAVVRGSLVPDSLRGKFSPVTGAFSIGTFSVTDSLAGSPRTLYADSLPACRFLNQAEYAAQSDSTLLVHYTLLDLDPGSSADSCRGGIHADAVPIREATP